MGELSTFSIVVALAFVLAGFVKGVIGMGLPTVAIGVLTLFVAPAQAAALTIAPALITNIWQSLAGPNLLALLRRFWSMLTSVCVGIWAGGGLLAGDTGGRARLALGILLIVYALSGLMSVRFRVPRGAEFWLGPVMGLASGVITGITGVFVIPVVPYLQALDISRDEFIQALGISFVVSTLALAATLTRYGAFGLGAAGISLLAVLPAILGMILGQRVRPKIKPAVFRVVFLLGMLALGCHLVLRSVL